MPMWNVWIGPKAGLVVASGVGDECTDGAGAVFGAIANVSWLNRPTYSWWARPARLVSRSPWYHDTPKGKLGTWMTKVSNSVFPGSPQASMVIRSTAPSCLTVTRPAAFGRQPAAAMPAERWRSKRIRLPEASALEVWARPKPAVARATAPTAMVRLFMRRVLSCGEPGPCDPVVGWTAPERAPPRAGAAGA